MGGGDTDELVIDGKKYSHIRIGKLLWSGENISATKEIDSTNYYVVGNDVYYSFLSFPKLKEKLKNGWRVPTKSDFDELNYITKGRIIGDDNYGFEGSYLGCVVNGSNLDRNTHYYLMSDTPTASNHYIYQVRSNSGSFVPSGPTFMTSLRLCKDISNLKVRIGQHDYPYQIFGNIAFMTENLHEELEAGDYWRNSTKDSNYGYSYRDSAIFETPVSEENIQVKSTFSKIIPDGWRLMTENDWYNIRSYIVGIYGNFVDSKAISVLDGGTNEYGLNFRIGGASGFYESSGSWVALRGIRNGGAFGGWNTGLIKTNGFDLNWSNNFGGMNFDNHYTMIRFVKDV